MTAPIWSVVIPTHRRPRALSACLRALADLEPPDGGFEVVVVCDGHEPVDGVTEGNGHVTMLAQARAGPAAARNTGARQARGTELAFLDDDCLPERTWLRALANCRSVAPEAVIGGRTLNALTANKCAAASQLVLDCAHEHFNSPYRSSGFFASNNLAIPARHFRALNGFNPSFPFPGAEDRDLSDRASESGLPFRHAPEAVVHHWHDLTLSGFWSQQFTYGRGAWFYREARNARGLASGSADPSFYGRLLQRALAEGGASGAALTAISQMAYGLGLIRQAVRQRSHVASSANGAAGLR